MTGIVIPNNGTIGSASDTDAIAISSGGNVTLSQTLDGGAIGSAVTMSANQACVKTALNASGSAPIYACRAWVNFNGDGTVAIRGSANVSSITDNGTGDYTINITTALEDADYALNVNGGPTSDGEYSNRFVLFSKTGSPYKQAPTNSTARFVHQNYAFNFKDPEYVCASFFR